MSRKGRVALAIFSMPTLAILLATKRLTPTGGVIKPIANPTTIMIPKWIGSMPMLMAKGSSVDLP